MTGFVNLLLLLILSEFCSFLRCCFFVYLDHGIWLSSFMFTFSLNQLLGEVVRIVGIVGSTKLIELRNLRNLTVVAVPSFTM